MIKKFALLIMSCMFSFCPAVLASDSSVDDSNWGVYPQNRDEENAEETSSAEDIWNYERSDLIYNNYGSDQSPAFSNRENINPNECDYGYGSTDGLE